MGGYIVSLVGESCSLEQMISRCFDKDDLGQYGLNWLKNNFLVDIYQNRSIYINIDRKPVKNNSNNNYINEKELEQYRYYHPYMYERKLTNEIIDLFDIGYDKKTDCITFPVKDEQGNCLFIARRHTKYKYFNYPNNVEKPVYGLYELTKIFPYPRELYVCESMLDALTLWTHRKYAIALNGLGTKKQFEELNKLPVRCFIIATDNDKAGNDAFYRIKNNIKSKIITRIKLPNGRKDINECDEEEIENFLEIF